MMDYTFTKQADRQMRKFPIAVQRRIIKKLKVYLATEDPLHFADSIKGGPGKIYRFRIGDYRIIFDWLDDRIRVTKVKPRAKAY